MLLLIKNLNLRYLKRNLNLSIEHSIKLTIKRNTNGIAAIKHFKRLHADEIGFVDSLIAATHKNIKVVQYALKIMQSKEIMTLV
jgi:hypothetical protein